MRGDKRQIQTAVLGGPDSEEPLMLPMVVIAERDTSNEWAWKTYGLPKLA